MKTFSLLMIALGGLLLAGCGSPTETIDIEANAQKQAEGGGSTKGNIPTNGINN